ncbi:MAG: sigma-54-dependent transcriptional regulator [Candidatus Wenzhouxiangella sp. M2_3B_020]
MAATILIVDDEPDIRELVGEILSDEGYETVLAADASEARTLRAERDPDLVLLDVWMPDTDGISLLREWREQDRDLCPVVMISGHGSVEAAVEATRNGARDFIEKPVSMARLLSTVRKALAGGETAVRGAGDAEIDEIPEPIGRSRAAARLRERLDAVAASSGHVLVTGEPGSGRTTLARWLHRQWGSAGGSRIEVSCTPTGHLAERLAESDAAAAEGPTTLLLEHFEALGDADRAALEALLARAGAGVRVVAVAAPGIERLAADDRFDRALYHRIAENVVDVPPLRARCEDIPELVRDLSERLPTRENLPYRPIPVPVQNLLRQHDWTGNLRELVNLIRNLLQAGTDQPVEPEEVESLLARTQREDPDSVEAAHSPLFELPLREAREAFERQYLIARLRRAEGSVGQLAEAVEMERTHLYRKLRQLGIDPKRVQGEET